jgi:hypothetical protein
MMKAFRTLVNDGRAHEDCFKNINVVAFANALVKPLTEGGCHLKTQKRRCLRITCTA